MTSNIIYQRKVIRPHPAAARIAITSALLVAVGVDVDGVGVEGVGVTGVGAGGSISAPTFKISVPVERSEFAALPLW